jgi:hypothetical protein
MILKVQNRETNEWLVFDKVEYVKILEHVKHIKNKKEDVSHFMHFTYTDYAKKKKRKLKDYKGYINFVLFAPSKSESAISLTHITMLRKDKCLENVVFDGHGFLLNDSGEVIQKFENFKFM